MEQINKWIHVFYVEDEAAQTPSMRTSHQWSRRLQPEVISDQLQSAHLEPGN